MKKIIYFDLDNTIHSTKKQEIPSQTLKLLYELYEMPDVVLGLATGRSPSKIQMIDKIKHLFKYKIFINGSVAYNDDRLIYKNPIKKSDIKAVLQTASKLNISVGMVAKDKEYVTSINEDVNLSVKNFKHELPIIDPKAYEKTDIYQLWLFAVDQEKINEITTIHNHLAFYPWHVGGADLTDINTNKAYAIKKLLENEINYQLITVGDGKNDLKMIELADIGIAMNNSRFSELKEKADYIAPHVDDNQLYDFFKNNKIII